jgi:hypothetical protein
MPNLRIAFIVCPEGHRQRVMVDANNADFVKHPMRCNHPVEVKASRTEQVTVRVRETGMDGKEFERLVPTGQVRTVELAEYRACSKPCVVEVTNEPVLLDVSGAPHAANRLNEFEVISDNERNVAADIQKEGGG